MSPYQALYGRLPPTIPPYSQGSTSIQALEELLLERDTLLRSLKESLRQAQHRMTQKANAHRRDIQFVIGDKVLVKLRPYQWSTIASNLCPKLAKRFYGPFIVIAHVGPRAYKLVLPTSSRIHAVFYVSILKPYRGSDEVASYPLPLDSLDNQSLSLPIAVCVTGLCFHKERNSAKFLHSGLIAH